MKKILLLLPFIFLILFVLRKDSHSGKKKLINTKKTFTTKVSDFKLNERQKNILSVMKESKKHPMKYLESRIGNFNVRTLRRDLDKLQKMGLIKKFGSTKSAFYQKI
jgi:predicted HTH transcriptional regulator